MINNNVWFSSIYLLKLDYIKVIWDDDAPVFLWSLLKWKSCLVTREERLVNTMTALSLGGNQSKQKTQQINNR